MSPRDPDPLAPAVHHVALARTLRARAIRVAMLRLVRPGYSAAS